LVRRPESPDDAIVFVRSVCHFARRGFWVELVVQHGSDVNPVNVGHAASLLSWDVPTGEWLSMETLEGSRIGLWKREPYRPPSGMTVTFAPPENVAIGVQSVAVIAFIRSDVEAIGPHCRVRLRGSGLTRASDHVMPGWPSLRPVDEEWHVVCVTTERDVLTASRARTLPCRTSRVLRYKRHDRMHGQASEGAASPHLTH